MIIHLDYNFNNSSFSKFKESLNKELSGCIIMVPCRCAASASSWNYSVVEGYGWTMTPVVNCSDDTRNIN